MSGSRSIPRAKIRNERVPTVSAWFQQWDVMRYGFVHDGR